MEVNVLASGSTGNCYLIYDGATALLLDAGIPIKRIQAGCCYNLSKVSGCLVTHKHTDHSKAVMELAKRGVAVWMPALEIAEAGLRSRNVHSLARAGEDAYAAFQVGTFSILPFRTEHDTPEPVGYLLTSTHTGDKLLYVTDSYFIRYRFVGLTHMICECNYDEQTVWEKINSGHTPTERAKRLFRSHMSLGNFLKFLESIDQSKLRQIYVCHLSNDHANEHRIMESVQMATGAEVYICREEGGVNDGSSNANGFGQTSEAQKICKGTPMLQP